MFFDDEPLTKRKNANLAVLPPVPNTGWKRPEFVPDLSDAVAIAFDTETKDPELTEAGPGWARGRGHIVGVSLAAVDRRGNRGKWYFPLRHEVEGEDNIPPSLVMPELKKVFETPHIPKIGANLLYDVGWLSEEGIYVDGPLYDVQFAEALLCEDRVALDILGRKYLGEGKTTNFLYDWLRKAYRKPETYLRSDIYRAPPRLVGPYAEDDADLPLDIIDRQLVEISRQELDHVFRLECDLIPLLVRMRREGVSVDVAKAEQLFAEFTTQIIPSMYQQVRDEWGFDLGGHSDSGHLGQLLDHVGIPYPRNEPTQRNPDGTPKIQKEWLAALEHPLGDFLNSLREHEKLAGTFLKSYILDKNINGKIYPQFHPLKGESNGTMVGRFASSDPNLQNIPSRTKLGKLIRECFIPDPGHAYWRKHDYSQIHYRILAHYAVGPGSDELRARYCNDPDTDYHNDVFFKVAPLIGWDYNDPEVVKVKRRPIKNVNFGLLYGQSEKALAYKSGLSGDAAKAFFGAYHEGAPYVKPTMELIGQEVQEFGFVRTLLGRRVRFDMWEPKDRYGVEPLPFRAAVNLWGTNIRRAYEYRGVNYKFQGSEPDIMKTGMRDCLRSGVFDYTGVPRLTVHDELDFSVRDESPEMNEALRFVQETMQNAIRLKVPVKVDVSKGPNWGKAD